MASFRSPFVPVRGAARVLCGAISIATAPARTARFLIETLVGDLEEALRPPPALPRRDLQAPGSWSSGGTTGEAWTIPLRSP